MTATPIEYAPPGVQTAAKSRILIVPAIADIDAPTVAEINAASSIAIECAIEQFGISISPSTLSRKKLCHSVAQKKPGTSEYDDITMSATLQDPQGADQPIVDALPVGAVKYAVHRPGEDHETPIDTGDTVQVSKIQVATRYLNPVTTDEGQEYEMTAVLTVQDSTDLFVKVV